MRLVMRYFAAPADAPLRARAAAAAAAHHGSAAAAEPASLCVGAAGRAAPTAARAARCSTVAVRTLAREQVPASREKNRSLPRHRSHFFAPFSRRAWEKGDGSGPSGSCSLAGARLQARALHGDSGARSARRARSAARRAARRKKARAARSLFRRRCRRLPPRLARRGAAAPRDATPRRGCRAAAARSHVAGGRAACGGGAAAAGAAARRRLTTRALSRGGGVVAACSLLLRGRQVDAAVAEPRHHRPAGHLQRRLARCAAPAAARGVGTARAAACVSLALPLQPRAARAPRRAAVRAARCTRAPTGGPGRCRPARSAPFTPPPRWGARGHRVPKPSARPSQRRAAAPSARPSARASQQRPFRRVARAHARAVALLRTHATLTHTHTHASSHPRPVPFPVSPLLSLPSASQPAFITPLPPPWRAATCG
jgi:hypothetical protein